MKWILTFALLLTASATYASPPPDLSLRHYLSHVRLAQGGFSNPPIVFQNQGTPIGVSFTFNCSTGTTCAMINGVLTLTSSGGGGTIPFGSVTSGTNSQTLQVAGNLFPTGLGTIAATSVTDCNATNAGGVPSPPNDATQFLNGTCQFSVPPGGSGSPCTLTANAVQYNNAGAFGCLGVGTSTTVLHGSAAGVAAFGSVVSADLNITPTTCTNQVVTVISLAVAGTCTTLTKSFLPATTVFTDQSNTYSTGTQDFTSSTNALVKNQSASDNSTKAANTAYVTTAISNAIAAVNPAMAVQAATTAAADTSGFTYTHVAGIGDFFTGSVNTAVTIDGFTFTILGQRLLVKNDTQSPSGAFNGIYYVTQLQTAILAPILTRALDYDQPSDMNNTGAIPVVNGTVNIDTSWLLTSSVTTVGTDPLTFVRFTVNPSNIVIAVSPGVGIAHFAGSTQTVTSSAVVDGDLSGQVGVAHGGTALGTLTAHALYVGNGTSAPNALGLGTTVTVLHGNAGADPAYAVVTPSDAAGNTSGSGNFCLVTSCVMTTPNLGTPSAAVLTNATSVPLNQGTGSVPITSDRNGIHNFNQAAQSTVTVANTPVYITRSDLDMPAAYTTAIGAGTTMRWRVAMTKTAAGTGAFNIIIFKGTNGSTADTAVVTQSLGTQTAALDDLTMDVQLVFTSTTAAYWSIVARQTAASATGFGLVFPATATYFSGTISGQTTTTASDKYGLGFTSVIGTPTIVLPMVQAEALGVN